MKYLIKINILKIISKLFPNRILKNKINNFDLDKAHELIAMLTNAKKKNFALNEIKNIFFSSEINFKNLDDNFYDILTKFITNYDNSKKNKVYIKNQIKNLKDETLSHHSWLRLRNIFYLKSNFILGGICRKKSIDSLLKSKFSFFVSKRERLGSKIDAILNNKNFEYYLEDNEIKKNINEKLLSKFITSVFYNINNNLNLNRDKNKFFNMLDNKSVAIVGGAETDNNDGLEIDSYDLVCRLNHTDSNDNLNMIKKGSRTDITYVNGYTTDKLLENKTKISYKTKAVVIKYNNLEKIKKTQNLFSNLIVKEIDNYNFLTFYSTLNLLPLALLDLLETKVRKIKIFHLDLYLSEKKSYFPHLAPKMVSENKKLMLNSFVKHDPMFHHKFLKKLYEHPKIKSDANYQKVMKLSTQEYLEKLEDIY